MEKYKLKKEAKQFFCTSTHELTLGLSEWFNRFCIPSQLLEKVERVKVIYGHADDTSGISLMHTNQWSSEDLKGKIHFTLEISDIESGEFENIKHSKLMLGLQIVANKFFED